MHAAWLVLGVLLSQTASGANLVEQPVRVEYVLLDVAAYDEQGRPVVVLMNLHTKQGKAWVGGEPASGEFPAGGPSPSQLAVSHELADRVEGAISRLSDDHRRIVGLVHSRGYSLDAAAELMERSSEAARKLYSRALSELAKHLGLGRGGG